VTFFSKVMTNVTLTFVKDEKGVVTALVLRQGPNETRAVRK
jgi:hypothetical protein